VESLPACAHACLRPCLPTGRRRTGRRQTGTPDGKNVADLSALTNATGRRAATLRWILGREPMSWFQGTAEIA